MHANIAVEYKYTTEKLAPRVRYRIILGDRYRYLRYLLNVKKLWSLNCTTMLYICWVVVEDADDPETVSGGGECV